MKIIDSEEEIGAEIDCGVHGESLNDMYRVTLKKVSDREWMSVKYLFKTKKEKVLYRGTLGKVVDYVNRNFGYDDGAVEV